jgi:hypothetical protein
VAFVHGKDAAFTVNAVVLTTYLTSFEFNQDVDMAETSTMGLEAKTYISGLSDATFSIAGRYDSTAVSGPDVVLNALVGADTPTTFEAGPEGATTGKIKYSGSCLLTSYNVSADVGDVVAFTAEFQCTGPIVKAAYA